MITTLACAMVWAIVCLVRRFFNKLRSFFGNSELPKIASHKWTPILALDKPFEPSKFLGQKWSAAETNDLSDKIDLNNIVFWGDRLLGKERVITGEEKLILLRKVGCEPLNAYVFMALYLEEEQRSLEWIHKKNGATRLDFFGTIIYGKNYCRHALYLYRDNSGHWDYGFAPLEGDWHPQSLSGVVAP